MAAGAPSLEVRGRATRRPSGGATVAVGAVAVGVDPIAEQPGVVAVGRLSVHSQSVYQREQPLIRIGCSGLSVSSGGGGGCNWSVRARVREVVVLVPGGRLTFRGVEAGAPNSWCPSSAALVLLTCRPVAAGQFRGRVVKRRLEQERASLFRGAGSKRLRYVLW